MFPLLWLHWKRFQSTPSVWRETGENHAVCIVYSISIHSLRVEGDAVSGEDGSFTFEFQSTPSVWRETTSIITSSATNPFQSTPSVWRETWKFVRDMMKT